jgi:hypothetical protein
MNGTALRRDPIALRRSRDLSTSDPWEVQR